ncbi:MAG: AbrB/MazE/SpoVT family DNA-binding domain-containing protein [Pseudomonadota bacterium]
MNFSTTKMSSKGQIVIPEEVRKTLHLKEGDQFFIIGRGDTVILKAITPPDADELDDFLEEAQKAAKKAGIKKSDVKKMVQKVRKNK